MKYVHEEEHQRVSRDAPTTSSSVPSQLDALQGDAVFALPVRIFSVFF